jgi:hypothetical protein
MSYMTTIPVTVTPEATARLAELGFQQELDLMLQHTLQSVPALRSVAVQLALPYDTGEEPTIVIEATANLDATGICQAEQQWGNWVINTFPPQVWAYIRILTIPGNAP